MNHQSTKNDVDKTTNVFTYGTLMYKQVMYGLVKKQDYKSEPVVLKNYTRKQVKNRAYPGITKQIGKEIQGVIYHHVQQPDIKILHNFEGNQYKAEKVEVYSKDGKKYEAMAYVYADPSNLEEKQWNVQNFQKNHKSTFVNTHIAPY